MKTLLIFLLFAKLLFATPSVIAGDIESRPIPLSGTQKVLSPSKEDPEPNLDGIVEVSFKIDNEGKVQILNINSTSPQLADYVIKKLGKVQLEQGSSQIGKVIKYRFVFKKQA